MIRIDMAEIAEQVLEGISDAGRSINSKKFSSVSDKKYYSVDLTGKEILICRHKPKIDDKMPSDPENYEHLSETRENIGMVSITSDLEKLVVESRHLTENFLMEKVAEYLEKPSSFDLKIIYMPLTNKD